MALRAPRRDTGAAVAVNPAPPYVQQAVRCYWTALWTAPLAMSRRRHGRWVRTLRTVTRSARTAHGGPAPAEPGRDGMGVAASQAARPIRANSILPANRWPRWSACTRCPPMAARWTATSCARRPGGCRPSPASPCCGSTPGAPRANAARATAPSTAAWGSASTWPPRSSTRSSPTCPTSGYWAGRSARTWCCATAATPAWWRRSCSPRRCARSRRTISRCGGRRESRSPPWCPSSTTTCVPTRPVRGSPRSRRPRWSASPGPSTYGSATPSGSSTRSCAGWRRRSGRCPRSGTGRWSCTSRPASAPARVALGSSPLQPPVRDRLGHPGDHLVEHFFQPGGGFEAEHLTGLGYVGDALVHVVLERLVVRQPQRYTRPLDLSPDHLGQLGDGRRARRGEVEVLVQRGRVLHRGHNPPGQVTAVRVMPDLRAVAQDVQRVLALEHLLHEVGDHVGHGELHVAGEHLGFAERPALADAHTVERPHDRVRQAVLVERGAGEVLHGELLEAVRRQRRRDAPLVALLRWPPVGR